MLRSNSKSLGNHVVRTRRRNWKAVVGRICTEKEGFKSGMKERLGDGELIIIISLTVSGIAISCRRWARATLDVSETNSHQLLLNFVRKIITRGDRKVLQLGYKKLTYYIANAVIFWHIVLQHQCIFSTFVLLSCLCPENRIFCFDSQTMPSRRSSMIHNFVTEIFTPRRQSPSPSHFILF